MTHAQVTSEELIAFAADELASTDADRIRHYVERHPTAAETVALYRLARRQMAADDSVAPAPELIARAKDLFMPADQPSWLDRLTETIMAALVFDSRREALALRSPETEAPVFRTYEVDGAEIDIRIAELDGGRREVIGQITATAPITPIEAALTMPGDTHPAHHTLADDTATFTIIAPAGHYDLHVRLGDEHVVVPELDMT